jgi:hypothetical protein
LRANWTTQVAQAVSTLLTARDVRVWSHVLQAGPVPPPNEVVAAVERHLHEADNEAYARDVEERLAAVGGIPVLQVLTARGGTVGDAVRPFVAEAGDQGAVRQQLAALRTALTAGERVRGSDVRWLAGARDTALLDELFACLRLAGKPREPGPDPYGDPSGPLVAAIRRVDTQGALGGTTRCSPRSRSPTSA